MQIQSVTSETPLLTYSSIDEDGKIIANQLEEQLHAISPTLTESVHRLALQANTKLIRETQSCFSGNHQQKYFVGVDLGFLITFFPLLFPLPASHIFSSFSSSASSSYNILFYCCGCSSSLPLRYLFSPSLPLFIFVCR